VTGPAATGNFDINYTTSHNSTGTEYLYSVTCIIYPCICPIVAGLLVTYHSYHAYFVAGTCPSHYIKSFMKGKAKT